MSDDAEFLSNYRTDELYIHPGPSGAYATIVTDGAEVELGEVEITARCKLAVSAFYVRDKSDFNSFKITKLKWSKRDGWHEEAHIRLSYFNAARMAEFVGLFSHLDLGDAQKARLSLDSVNVTDLSALLASTKGAAVLQELAESPQLHQDIYAVAAKRAALTEFEAMLGRSLREAEWQAYFERNPWVFGHGLNYVFLDKVGPKLETRTTGSAFGQPGKTADGLMRTRAALSQYVLIEIKRDATKLLQKDRYRPGCWAVSDELSAAVTQSQKTTYEFARGRFRDELKDAEGNELGEVVYSLEPRSYLVVGNMAELRGNGDKIACFELYRRNVRSPEILTFDELFHRAKCIVENLGGKPTPREHEAPQGFGSDDFDDDDIPF
ncbi:hypothetical protein GGQ88_000228 [Novosphingobium hassiacum]|uniref:Shedu protein SduA C-terminal domain-containing protein n=1 Tax=Novosphingobium hassiacum TaxID=173676 RepID=A0A7W5ZTU3_9SPHN|nr:Shedu immune nuclease family protein [Novosphingobium hassiacum]MBB3858988.1 hypothetical protein [Novosphingobium hassiacum]